ncbi:hypothetical protein ABK040_009850 [Willaertia magna]
MLKKARSLSLLCHKKNYNFTFSFPRNTCNNNKNPTTKHQFFSINIFHQQIKKKQIINKLINNSLEEHNNEEEQKENNKIEPGLYVVGTPIGNLQDITDRAKFILQNSSLIACEDTRTTRKILNYYKLTNNQQQLISFVENKNATSMYNQSKKNLEIIIKKLNQERQVVSLVSECGMPAISDPGWILVKHCHEIGIPVFTVPGPSSVTSALSISGFNCNKFIFEGFLSSIPKKRRKLLLELREIQGERCIVFFENPNRLKQTINDCLEIFGEDRYFALCFELTKLFERVQRGKLGMINRMIANEEEVRGECTIVISPETFTEE